MRFAPTTEQLDLRDVVRALWEDRCPPAVIRAAATDPADPSILALYRDFAELGAAGLLIDERAGGLGLDENYLVPVLIEVGRAGVPLPITETIAVAAGIAGAVGLDADLAAGNLRVACDLQVSVPAARAHSADVLLAGGWGGRGEITVLYLAGAQLEAVEAMDPAADLCRIQGAAVLHRVADPVLVEQAWNRGVLGAAAELVGLSRRMLDLTVAYVAERRQFGVPIGSFQAVKHQLASALIAVEFAAPTVARAGAALAAGDEDAGIHACTAKALASDAARQVARAAIQCHGAIAYTTEYDLHLFAKRAWFLAAAWGSAAWHRDRIAGALGLPSSGRGPTQ
ncbi:acyl-CoA dehydrogenase [Nakamurella silvestris]|nr:acyl-CoA dehydrogenase [Nakamurella silvestris]